MKKVALCISVVILSLAFPRISSSPIEVSARPESRVHNIDSGLDYETIQGAIDASATLHGHTILVDAGTYYEHVVIGKSVTLVGEDRSTTFIDGGGNSAVVNVTANNVSISGFTIQNGGKYGVRIVSSSGHNISDNTVADNGDLGVIVYDSSGNFIVGNTIAYNYRGMWLDDSSHNYLRHNVIVGNTFNFRVLGSQLSYYTNDVDTSNTVQGKPVYYWLNRHDEDVPPDAGYVALVNSTGISVENLSLKNNWDGVLLAYTNNSLIRNVTVTNNYWDGIYLRASCNNNTIIGNMITYNSYGIILRDSCNNNTIYHNNFFGNARHVSIMGTVTGNVWDNGYPSGGNYWGNHTGADSDRDGVADKPYASDRYPLMGMFSGFNATSQHEVTTVCNSTISGFEFDRMDDLIRFNVSGEGGTEGFCRICIPTALMSGPYKVFVNYTEVSHNLLPFSNSTYSYLYFTYSHSEQQVVILPEFPSILPLFIAAALLASAITRTKLIRRSKPRQNTSKGQKKVSCQSEASSLH